MYLKKFIVKGLFKIYDHTISFPPLDTKSQSASTIMIHGENGIGKTTILKMIEGVLRLKFDVYRKVPFKSSELQFSNNKKITIQPKYEKDKLIFLHIKYDDVEVKLDPEKIGPLNEKEEPKQNSFIKKYNEETNEIAFDLIDTKRLLIHMQNEIEENKNQEKNKLLQNAKNHLKRSNDNIDDLSGKVKRFIRNSQINYRRYFHTQEPELFEKLMGALETIEKTEYNEKDLIDKLKAISQKDEKYETSRIGLSKENFVLSKIQATIKKSKASDNKNVQLAILNSYIEVLETSQNERILIANRLLTFERLVNSFFKNKTIAVSVKEGLTITTKSGDLITEFELSSGEFHLLYLMVSALITKRLGTVIAIDEPEISLHIKWQRKLMSSLIECSSNANPQFIIATHSPDVISSFENDLKTKELL